MRSYLERSEGCRDRARAMEGRAGRHAPHAEHVNLLLVHRKVGTRFVADRMSQRKVGVKVAKGLQPAFPSDPSSRTVLAVKAPRSPWQNPCVERLIGSIRRECLDHVILW